jgi:rSAM/selenodomain-associated transferase 1
MSRNLCGIFMKYPEPGRVKTRLAKDVGPKRAAEIYRQVAERVMKNTLPLDQDYRSIVLFDPPEQLKDFRSWLNHEQFISQQGIDIGERMDLAIRALLDRGAEKAVLTGADIPDLNRDIISEAFAALDHADIVIGPAKDGGYYLIGMKEPHSEIFQGIPWSTEKVFEKTVQTIRELRLSHADIRTLSDLDRTEDYSRFLIQNARLKPERSS